MAVVKKRREFYSEFCVSESLKKKESTFENFFLQSFVLSPSL
ncbi:hypothetical protein HOLDEFILI_02855 [Holdemania filiformis DSM 12042]|uniref:Uncharacterized protein n=1 Tax=Holdemania filiformis DSM 12042 TaxID=545696 RepID=B9YAJ8_9FIRM|nr:hypothetical protein HOLDEFILI_02855 [Holdemania filiformis DSM 12042]